MTARATHERVADPWLARDDYHQAAAFDSLGTTYMGEQSLDCMVQIVEMPPGTTLRSGWVRGPGMSGESRG